MLGPINERLSAEGKPTITAAQLEAGTRDVVQTAVREGPLDRETLIGAIVQNTGLSRADAEEIGDRIQAQYQGATAQVQGRLHAVAERARRARSRR
jgi:hypothetical protein